MAVESGWNHWFFTISILEVDENLAVLATRTGRCRKVVGPNSDIKSHVVTTWGNLPSRCYLILIEPDPTVHRQILSSNGVNTDAYAR